jgi:FtsP/CotA-like multicopper oxidase with cupredoxin domain
MTEPITRRDLLAGVAATLSTLPADARGETGAVTRLEARTGVAHLSPGVETPILGFDGAAPGPLLRRRQGDLLDVRFLNRLDLPASIHWHGMRGDNAMDGVAPLTQPAVPPGGAFDYRRPLREPGLFCYRPSVFGGTPELMARGLKGLMIIDESTLLDVDADLALVLDDWRLEADGRIAGPFPDPTAAAGVGRVGPLLSVNGAPAPARKAFPPGSRVRLRLANLANARIMAIGFEGIKPYVIAIDSQPCDPFEPVRRTIPVAPGARFELVFDMPETADAQARVVLRSAGGSDRDLFVAATEGGNGPARRRGPVVAPPRNPVLPPEIRLAESRKVDLVIAPGRTHATAPWTINGTVGGYSGAPLFRTRTGAPVTLGFINRAVVPIAMHVHGQAMRLLHDLDDGWEPYWRNAVIVPPGKTKHVAFIPDAPGKWAIHDDILEHEAAGLATWFEVD